MLRVGVHGQLCCVCATMLLRAMEGLEGYKGVQWLSPSSLESVSLTASIHSKSYFSAVGNSDGTQATAAIQGQCVLGRQQARGMLRASIRTTASAVKSNAAEDRACKGVRETLSRVMKTTSHVSRALSACQGPSSRNYG